MSLTPPPPPAAPSPSECSAQGGINLQTTGGHHYMIALDYIQEVNGNSKSWSKPTVEEVTFGGKMFKIKGTTDEIHVSTKTEQIIPNETKGNLAVTDEYVVGTKYEVIPSTNKEFNIAAKVHLTPMHGRRWGASNISMIGHEKREMAKHKRTIQDYERTLIEVASYHAAHKYKVESADQRVGKLVEKAQAYELEVGSGMLDSEKRIRAVKGDEKHSGGTYSIESQGEVTIEGASITLKGGGKSLVCQSNKVTFEGTTLKVTK